mmetsp:Transcript_24193/g.82595  ORF Transcript_24193/g.82595 Transcript_24193/m.82595 type:complete len:371 (+) Transcript_24193:173-1285(+)
MGCMGSKPAPGMDTRKKMAKPIRDTYKFGKKLGTGGFAIVKLGTHIKEGTEWAIKIMSVPTGDTQDDKDAREDIFNEISLLTDVKHDSVLYMKEYAYESGKVYLVTELLPGGELLDAVIAKGTYNEADARRIFKQLISGLKYLHNNGVVHRDLKLENLLLKKQNDISQVKIADFGLAKKAAESAMATICGTPQYVAPEMISGEPQLTYSSKVDMWSCGVILYILLGGYPPFYDENENEAALYDQIRNARFDFDDEVWEQVSKDAKSLIRSLLCLDTKKRYTCEQVLADPWMQSGAAGAALAGTQDKLKATYRSKLKSAAATIMAINRMKNMVGIDLSAGVTSVDVEETQQVVGKGYAKLGAKPSKRINAP